MQEKRDTPMERASDQAPDRAYAKSTSGNHSESAQSPGPALALGVDKVLSPAAQRALAEAEARRAALTDKEVAAGRVPREINGRSGPDPVRYGDWENKGIISDF